MRLKVLAACKLALAIPFLCPVSAHALSVGELVSPILDDFFPADAFQQWTNDYFSKVDRAGRLELASRFPGIFKIHFVCQFVAAGKEAVAIIPGDWIDAPSGGTLNCPDGESVAVAPKSKLQLQQIAGGPTFFLESGSALIHFGPAKFTLRMREGFFYVEGKGSRHQLEMTTDGSKETIRCNAGNISGRLSVEESTDRLTLESFLCRMEFVFKDGSSRFLYAGESVSLLNFRLLRRSFWPPQPVSKPPEGMAGFNLVLHPRAAPDGNKLEWIIFKPAPSSLRCVLYAQKAENGKAEEVVRLESSSIQGELLVPPAFAKAFLSLVCEGEAFMIASPRANFAPVPWNISIGR
jgi:hypothetical protein